MIRRTLSILLPAWLALTLWMGPAHATDTDTDPPAAGTYADYNGEQIDLTADWGGAAACAITEVGNRCFESETAMDQWLGSIEEPGPYTAADGDTGEQLMSTCSSALRLYSAVDFGGDVLQLSTRGIWHNLSNYGFNNRTSSYKVGACSSWFRDGANGSGSLYPGDTSANANASSMLSGWNNRVSSVRIL